MKTEKTRKYTVRFTGTLEIWGTSKTDAKNRAKAELEDGVNFLLAARVGSLMEKGYIGKMQAAGLAADSERPKFLIEYVK